MRESFVRDQGNAGAGIFDWPCDSATGTSGAAGAVGLRDAGAGEAVKASVAGLVGGMKPKSRLHTKTAARNREIPSAKVALRSSRQAEHEVDSKPAPFVKPNSKGCATQGRSGRFIR